MNMPAEHSTCCLRSNLPVVLRVERRQRSRQFPRRAVALLVLAGLAAALSGGCAGGGGSRQAASDPGPAIMLDMAHPALAPLVRAAQREHRRPVREASALPPPPGVDPTLAVSVSTDGRAHVPLSEAIERLAAEAASKRPNVSAAPAAEREAALRSYLMGRQKLIEGEPAGAIDDLRHATRLDPASPEPWRELGEAALALGLRSEAVSAFNNAIDRGLEDARMLELLGREAIDRNEYQLASGYLARATLADPQSHDPLLPQIIDVSLARSLAGIGYIAAARDAITRALERPSPTAASTRYFQEYGTIFRRQGDLWREVGDAECRLGRFDHAIQAYQRAAGLPSLDEEALTARLVFAAMRAGRPAAAALGVLAEIVESGGLATTGHIALLRHIAGTSSEVRWNSPVRLDTSAAVASLQTSLHAEATPSVHASLARAQAAVLTPAAARPVLRSLLISHGPDLAAARDLINLCDNEADAAREAAQIVAARADTADDLAEAILASSLNIAEVLSILSAEPRSGPSLLAAAYIHARMGRAQPASDLLDQVPDDGRVGAAITAARFEFALAAARDVEIESLRQIAPASPAAARLLARALGHAQHHAAAIDLLRSFLESPETLSRRERFEVLLLAGELAIAAARADEAERWLRSALSEDRHDERAYSQLLSLHAPNGLRPDANRSGQIVRDLRQQIPESRTADLLLTRELARRGLLPQAESLAMDVAKELPDIASMEVLASIWQLQASRGDDQAIERGLAWMNEIRERRPYSSSLLAGSTMILVHANRTADAATLLRDAIDDGAGRDAYRLLERIVRDGLRQRREADEIAEQRLSGRRLIPVDALDLAELLQRRNLLVEALEALRPILDPEVTLAGDMTRRLLILTEPIAQRAIQSEDDEQFSLVAGLFDRIAARNVVLPPELHELRISLLSRHPAADSQRITDAVKLAVQQHLSFRFRLYIVAAEHAVSADRGDLARELVGAAFESTPRIDPEMFIGTADVLVRRAIQSGDDARSRLAAELLDQIVQRQIALTAELHELRIVLLASSDGAEVERILAAADLAAQQHADLRSRAYITAFEAAGAAGNEQLAYDLLHLACTRIERPDPELIGRWFMAIVARGDARDARVMIDNLHGRQLLTGLFTADGPDGGADPRAYAAMAYGIEFSRRGRNEVAREAYELALEYDPNEGWACNNLGYMLLEARRDLDRADELLTRASALLPDEIPVLDSLGWLRYVQGRFHDVKDEQTGEIVMEGAVSLLRRAAESEYGQQSAVILDHYGDALWQVGQVEDAQRQWRAARDRAAARIAANQSARERITRMRAQQREEALLTPVQEQEYRDILRSTRAKIAAINEGREPAVAAIDQSGEAPPPASTPDPEAESGRAPEKTESGLKAD